MKKIVLILDDDVYRDLRAHMTVRGLAQTAYGIGDEFLIKLIESIEAGMEEKHFFFKKKAGGQD